MSDATIVVIVAAIPTTIAAIGAMLVSLLNARKTEAVSKKVDAVHALANSNLHAATSALQVANEKIAGLERLISSMKLAQETAKERAQENAQKLENASSRKSDSRVKKNIHNP